MASQPASAIPKKPLQQIAPTVQWNSLDVFQRQFCESFSENIRLLAPAGSGKTQSLLWRCAQVYRRQDEKARFLVVTFTRAARDELRTRLSGKEFTGVADAIEVATLNAWGYRRIRTHHHSPKLLTTERDKNYCAQNALQPVWRAHARIERAMKAQPYVVGPVLMNVVERLKTLGFRHPEGDEGSFLANLELLCDLGLDHLLRESILKLHDLDIVEGATIENLMADFLPFWIAACDTMIESLFTLEDQKYVALLDLQRQLADRRLPVGGSRLTHVLVDEFQDINPLDLELIKAIVKINKSELTIVGDDDQAIFEWRGASPNYILTPGVHFGRPFDTYILERNYRCPRNLVEASQRLIIRNSRRQPKRVEPMNPATAEVTVIRRESFTDSIDSVMEEVRRFLSNHSSPAKMAIVSRKRAQLIPYQILMAGKNLPFYAAEDLQVFLSTAFETLRKMLEICATAKAPHRPFSLIEDITGLCNQVKRFPLKKSERDRVATHLRAARPRSYGEAISALAAYEGPLKGPNDDGNMSLDFASRLAALLAATTVADAIDVISGNFAGLEKDYGKAAEDIFFADPPFLYLTEFAKRYEDDFGRFLDDLDLAKDTLARLPGEDDVPAVSDAWTQPVHLMTALRAKGKEFDTVVILDANDGIWPSRHAESQAQKEQERRLFYVAMTRAKRKLVLTLSGRIGDHVAVPSPYLAEAGLQ